MAQRSVHPAAGNCLPRRRAESHRPFERMLRHFFSRATSARSDDPSTGIACRVQFCQKTDDFLPCSCRLEWSRPGTRQRNPARSCAQRMDRRRRFWRRANFDDTGICGRATCCPSSQAWNNKRREVDSWWGGRIAPCCAKWTAPPHGARPWQASVPSSTYDRLLPKDVAVSSINPELGSNPVEPAYARIQGREKWAIPWTHGMCDWPLQPGHDWRASGEGSYKTQRVGQNPGAARIPGGIPTSSTRVHRGSLCPRSATP